MSRTLRSGRILSLCAAIALVGGSALPATGLAATNGHSASRATASQTAYPEAYAANTDVLSAAKGTQQAPGDIALSIDGWDGTGSKLAGIRTNGKAIWGVRFTLTPEQSPFTLTQIAALIAPGSEGGLMPGEAIEIVIMSDASASGNPANANTVYRQLDVVKDIAVEGGFFYALTTPVTVAQGDVYILIADRSTDTENTAIFYYDKDKGAPETRRSFFRGSTANVANGTGLILLNDAQIADGTKPFQGNFIVRGFGAKAVAGTPITGYANQPVDATLPAITNLAGVISGSGVTLTWTPPSLPIPSITNVNEAEPNNSPATAQNVGVNVNVAGTGKSADPGSPGGFCDASNICDDVEDWYAFTLTAPTFVQIDLTGFGANDDFDLLLYNAAGPYDPAMTVAQSGLGAGEDEHIEGLFPAGSYVVAVSAFDPGVAANANYSLKIATTPKILSYNIFCGTGDFTPSAATFIGTAGGDATSFTVVNSAPGSSYKVTYVAGASQSAGSNAAGGAPCAGGPAITAASIKIKSKNGGSLKVKNAALVAGTVVLINGTATNAGTVKKGTFTVKPLGLTLTKGQTVTVTFQVPNAGCTEVTGIVVK